MTLLTQDECALNTIRLFIAFVTRLHNRILIFILGLKLKDEK